MFENVVGHINVKKILKEQLETGQVSHAYIFYGKDGIGKEKLAEEFAKVLLEVEHLETSPDYKYIKKQEDKTQVLVDQMRKDIIEDINIVPAASKYKVYVIDDGDLLNEEAQNTMLKTLEEPPNYVVIMIIAKNLNSFLPTVISRTNNIAFEKLTDEEISQIIGTENVTEDILLESDGSAKKAYTLLNTEDKEMYTKIKLLVEAINKKQKTDILLKLVEIDFKRADIEYLQQLLLQSDNYIAVRYVEEAKNNISKNANEDIVKTALAIKLC